MKNNILKKAISAFLIVMVVTTMILPNTASAKELPNDGGETAHTLLYGDDTNEYALGVAAMFALFGESVSIQSSQDCEGRIAAEEFSIDNYGNPFTIKGLTNVQGGHQEDAATVICNNSTSKKFGYVYAQHNGDVFTYATSTDVTAIIASDYDTDKTQTKALVERVYTVPRNSLIDFSKELAYLKDVSENFAEQPSGTFDISNRIVTFSGNNDVNYYTLTADDWDKLNKSDKINFDIQGDGYAIINVPGEEIVFGANIQNIAHWCNSKVVQNGVENCRFLFNFYEATDVCIMGNGSVGCILAVGADVYNSTSGGHNFGQLIGKNITQKNEQGAFCFTMPKSDLPTPPEPAYTAHYVYYDAEGELQEIPADLYSIFIGRQTPPNATVDNLSAAYKPNDKLQAMEAGSNKIDTARLVFKCTDGMELYDTLYGLGLPIRFAVYEDGKTWINAKTGSDLLNADIYSAMTRKSDMDWTTQYTFTNSNVYFVLYPLGKITIDVSWDDKQNKSDKRPDDFYVSLIENVPDADATTKTQKEKNEQELLANTATTYQEPDAEVNKDILYEKYSDTFEYYVPLFGKQPDSKGQDSSYTYGTTVDKYGVNGLFNIEYTVPESYKDVTVTCVDKSGTDAVDTDGVVARFHVILRGEYKARFFLVEDDGTRTEVYKDNFYDTNAKKYTMIRGYGKTKALPELRDSEINSLFGTNQEINRDDYEPVWQDIKTGKYYVPGDDDYSYAFDYEDVIFETSLRRDELIENVPWLYTHIISYMDSNYIPGYAVPKRLELDNTIDSDNGGFTFIQKSEYTTEYSYSTLKDPKNKFDEDTFFMMTFAYGVDCERAAATRMTVSTEGFGRKDEKFFTPEALPATKGTLGCAATFLGMSGKDDEGVQRTAQTIQQMLPRDPYKNDYDGMRYCRLVLPTEEYENAILYFTVYYIDEEGQESVWFHYVLNMKNNPMWKIVK